jgi:hypothetical protein
VVLVGGRKDSETYVRSKKKACAEVRTLHPCLYVLGCTCSWLLQWFAALQGQKIPPTPCLGLGPAHMRHT